MVMMLLLLQSLQGRLLPDATASKGRHLALPLAMSINIRVSSYALSDRTQCMTLWLERTQWVSRFDLQHDLAIQEALFVSRLWSDHIAYNNVSRAGTNGPQGYLLKNAQRASTHTTARRPAVAARALEANGAASSQAPGSSTACRRHRWWCRAVAAAMRADRGVRV